MQVNLKTTFSLQNSLSKSSFHRLLQMKMYESFFNFDQKYYKRCDGVAMGSPLGPLLDNVLECVIMRTSDQIIVQLSLNCCV